jgi:hypothetical protein
MFCRKCGEKLGEEFKFCVGCGKELNSLKKRWLAFVGVLIILGVAITIVVIATPFNRYSEEEVPTGEALIPEENKEEIEKIRDQLLELDSSSYSDIKGWLASAYLEITNELDDFELTLLANDTNGKFLKEGFLEDELRFVEWRFSLKEEGLEIVLVYLTIEHAVTVHLSSMDKHSLTEVLEWVEGYEDEEGLDVLVLQRIIEGNYFTGQGTQHGQEFFVEWDFTTLQLSDTYRVRIELRYKDVKRVSFGETFELYGVEFTFIDGISGRRIEEPNTLNDRYPYIAVPVIVRNLSEEQQPFFSFQINEFNYEGVELANLVRRLGIRGLWELYPGEVVESYVFFIYEGEGTYIVEVSHTFLPFTVKVAIPVYGVEIPEKMDRE